MKKSCILILIIIILLQIGLYIYLGNCKKGMHMDEAYSYGLMNYHEVNITKDKNFLNNWHPREYFLDYLELNSDELGDLKQVYINQINDVHPPLYYYLLRLTSLFNINKFSMWGGLILNIVVLAISTIIVFIISKYILNSVKYALIVVGMNAFSTAMMESAMFIRMYALLTLIILLYTVITIKIINNNKVNKKDYIVSFFILICGGLTHYYFFVYVLGMYLIILIKSLRNKNTSLIKNYTILLAISAVIYLIVFPYAIEHVFFSNRAVGTINEFTLSRILEWLQDYIGVINKNIFNYFLWIYIIFMVLIYTIFKILEKKQLLNVNIVERPKTVVYILFATVFYFIVIALISPYKELRYILPICPLIIILTIYYSKIILDKYLKQNQSFLIMLSTTILITLSAIVTNNKLRFTFSAYEMMNENIQNKGKTIVYLYQGEEDRFLDNIYYFTFIDEAYIMKKEDYSLDKVLKIIEQKNKESFCIIDGNKFTFYE